MITVAFIWDNLTRLSGVTTWLLQCIERLPEHGVDPWVIDLGNTQGRELDIERWRRRILFLPCCRRRSEAGWRRSIRRALEQRDIRAVIFNEHRFGEDVMWSLPRRFPAANVLHADRPDDAYYRLAAELDAYLEESWCVSPSIARKFKAVLPEARHERVQYLPLGIPLPGTPSVSDPAEGAPVHLLYSGRISQKQKRILDIPAFCAALDQRSVNWRFHVVGDGPDMAELRRQSESWIAAGRLVLHGAVSYERAMEIAGETHVLLLFSSYEGMPLSLLEAMARGNLPVVTDIESGIADVLHDTLNARLFPVGDPGAAAACIRELADDVGRLRHLREEAMVTAGRFDQGPCMEAYAERIRCLALPDDQRVEVWKRARPEIYLNRSWRTRLCERLPGWMAGNET